MSGSTSIGLVGESLQDLLVGEWRLQPEVTVTILGPDEAAGDRRVNLFLYRVAENAFLKNRDWQLRQGTTNTLVPPPLSLNLSYMLTAYAPNDESSGNATAHGMLGEAMRVLHEHPVVPDEYLATGLKNAVEELRIVHVPLPLEELSRIWGNFSPFRVSACYEISVVEIESRKSRPLPGHVRTVGVPDVAAPYAPPMVIAIRPQRGAAGSALEFAGEHLAGWRAAVRVSGTPLAGGVELTGDTFTVQLPAAIEKGLHEVRVDISGLFRRTFLFEVT